MSERDAEANKTIDNQKSIETDLLTENPENVPIGSDEFTDTVKRIRQTRDAVRNPPLCPKCNKPMGAKKGHLLPDGGNMVTWLCRECGRRVEINHGGKL